MSKTINMSDTNSNSHWTIFGHKLPKAEIVYFSQTLLIFIVVITSIVNLSLGHDEAKLWTALLSSSLGYILPNPKLKRNG